MKIKKYIFVFLAFLSTFYFGRCEIVGVLVSPTPHEQKIPAQYKLKDHDEQGILVFVDKAPASGAQDSIQEDLSDMIDTFLVKKAGVKSKYIVSYREIAQLQAQKKDFAELSPVQVGDALDVGLVLYVLIENYSLYKIPDHDYYNGSLFTRSVLFDVSASEVLWPLDGDGKAIKAVIEFENKGREAALDRLTTTTAHCVSRYLYDCSKARFKTSAERRDYNSELWK